MKKIVIAILAMAMLSALMVVAPVMATPKADSPAWYKIAVSQPSAQEISYDDLTTLCLDAGLKNNPYPVPTTSTVVVNFPMYYEYSASEYRVFTFQIGDTVYDGISYDVFNTTLNLLTGNGVITFDSVWYLGDLGRMQHGFDASIIIPFYGWNTANYYYTGTMSLNGFGHFNGQTAELTLDTRVNAPPSGYLTVLGNRIK